METLKLEQLKPYPFGVDGIRVIADNDGVCRYINGIYTNGNVNLIPSIGEQEWFEVERLKIVAHPLSDLTNPIQHNGEEFVPIDRLFLLYKPLTKTRIGLEKDIQLYTTQMSYDINQKLFEWKFDVFGLIKKGLAIDVNTIDNPYK